MSPVLPQYIAPERLAKEGAHLEGQVKLREEEILPGLPISPLHALQECAVGEQARPRDDAAASPFQVLKKLTNVE